MGPVPSASTEAARRYDLCRKHLASAHGGTPQAVGESLAEEVRSFQPLVERSLAYRAETIRVADRLKAEIREGKPLSGRDLDTLNNGVVAHLALRAKLYEIAQAHECWLDLAEASLPALGLTRETRLKGVMLSLSAALTLYDNYLLAISVYEEDGKLRRFLNHRDSGYQIGRAELAKVTAQYNCVENRERVRRAIRFWERERERLSDTLQEDPGGDAYLALLISQSPSYNAVRGLSPITLLARNLDFLGAVTHDTLASLGSEGVNLFSMLFGNTIGLVESRKGKLYGRADVAEALRARLRAGDILVEKTPFRLSDKLIPGYWGHAAVWVGAEEELMDLGIWRDPLVQKHAREIHEGRRIVEALRSGVELNTLDHFLNIDDLAVLRGPPIRRDDLAKVVIRALRQVGKSYDFNFDAETTDRIFCSKLVYLSHSEIDWPTAKALGRSTVSPDDVASKALHGGPLEVVALFHDGEAVREDPAGRFAGLMADARGEASRRGGGGGNE
ncbi:MAG: Poxvirus G6 [Deltaproteobacteria bacterium]|nr:Poxvirus G6 [Deltaproteobacteria bacterium]